MRPDRPQDLVRCVCTYRGLAANATSLGLNGCEAPRYLDFFTLGSRRRRSLRIRHLMFRDEDSAADDDGRSIDDNVRAAIEANRNAKGEDPAGAPLSYSVVYGDRHIRFWTRRSEGEAFVATELFDTSDQEGTDKMVVFLQRLLGLEPDPRLDGEDED
ncbi:hypothetical protein HK405_007029 [Cladochytrium tenue]|nr:hypothetical protein HK405_007029 [Cladochytrium tenue]